MQATALTRAPGARLKHLTAAVALCAGLGAASMDAHAGAVIYNSLDPFFQTVALGVNNEGHLNFAPGVSQNAGDAIFDETTVTPGSTGLALNFGDAVNRDFRDATSPGCLCEGWGVAVSLPGGERVAGFANVAAGTDGLASGTFGATTTAATSTISLRDAPLRVVHSYGVSLDRNTFQGNITLTNTGSDTLFDVVYRRAMDWDVPPTEFSEFVTHSGVAANLENIVGGVNIGGNVRYASNNGFATSDPRISAGYIDEAGAIRHPGEVPDPEKPYDELFNTTRVVNSDFTDLGATDHGSVFDFAFGDLAAGESRTFNIFYGAYTTEAEALNAVATLQPTIYSLGQPNPNAGNGGCEPGCPMLTAAPASSTFGTDGSPTFLFAFGGVGGVSTEPGLDADHPLLPFVSAPGQFFFDAPLPRRWYDPPFASYSYELEGDDPLLGFTYVEVDDIEGVLDVLVDGTKIGTLGAFGRFDFAPDSLIRAFTLRATDVFRDAMGTPIEHDSDAARAALPVNLGWEGEAGKLLIAAIPVPTTDVPAPAALVLLLAGLAGLRLRRRTVH